ncbi:MAG: ribonuclease HII [Candidatus Peregrinibacteria bacterium]
MVFKDFVNSSGAVIAGIDEAGRGALAGPVVAGACILSTRIPLSSLIRDSKQLTASEREDAYAWLSMHALFAAGIAEAGMIDSDGILAATECAMQQAVEILSRRLKPTYLIIDGRDHFWFDIPHSSIVRGDESEPAISAASIVAKVTRDRLMQNRSLLFSAYGFASHKGYGTEEHFRALQAHGPCAIHRRTFLKNTAFAMPHA